MRAQPTPEMEAENAAYVWARQCLAAHAAEVAKARDILSDGNWKEIAWTFERLKIAYERYRDLEKVRTGK